MAVLSCSILFPMAGRREEVLKTVQARVPELSRFGVRSLSLFGSVARDEASEASDVDFLVDFEGQATFKRYMDLKFFLEDLLGMHVDLVTNAALRPRVRPNVER